jgi:hypothetical protein
MGKNVYFAILDILGFKEMVMNNDHAYLENVYSKLRDVIKQSIEENNTVLKGEKEKPVAHLDSENYNLHLKAYLISDSILLCSNGKTYKDFLNVSNVISSLVCKCFKIGCPVRGCVSFGALSIWNDKISIANSPEVVELNTFFGRAVVVAYQQEMQQEWSGCIVDKTAINQFNEYCDWLRKEHHFNDFYDMNHFTNIIPLFLKYEVPKKDGCKEDEEIVINWTWLTPFKHDVFTDKDIIDSFSTHDKSINQWGVKNKIKNTLEFMHFAFTKSRVAHAKLLKQ